MAKADYTFKHVCDVCEQRPILKDTGMCAVCTFGEADSMWEWLDDGVIEDEPKLVKQYLTKYLQSVPKLVDKKGRINAMMATLLHLDDHALDRIEEVL